MAIPNPSVSGPRLVATKPAPAPVSEDPKQVSVWLVLLDFACAAIAITFAVLLYMKYQLPMNLK